MSLGRHIRPTCYQALSISFSETLSRFPFYLIKPWSKTTFNRYIPWPHPWLMTEAAKKQAQYLYFAC